MIINHQHQSSAINGCSTDVTLCPFQLYIGGIFNSQKMHRSTIQIVSVFILFPGKYRNRLVTAFLTLCNTNKMCSACAAVTRDLLQRTDCAYAIDDSKPRPLPLSVWPWGMLPLARILSQANNVWYPNHFSLWPPNFSPFKSWHIWPAFSYCRVRDGHTAPLFHRGRQNLKEQKR